MVAIWESIKACQHNAWPESSQYQDYTCLDINYAFAPNPPGSFFGFPIYDKNVDWSEALEAQAVQIAEDNADLPDDMIKALQADLFRHPEMPAHIYKALYDTKMIPLPGHGGQVAIPHLGGSPDALQSLKQQRLARRFLSRLDRLSSSGSGILCSAHSLRSRHSLSRAQRSGNRPR
jgi:hypothetical protein